MFFVRDTTEIEKQRNVQSKRLKRKLYQAHSKWTKVCIAVLKENEIDCKVDTS